MSWYVARPMGLSLLCQTVPSAPQPGINVIPTSQGLHEVKVNRCDLPFERRPAVVAPGEGVGRGLGRLL